MKFYPRSRQVIFSEPEVAEMMKLKIDFNQLEKSARLLFNSYPPGLRSVWICALAENEHGPIPGPAVHFKIKTWWHSVEVKNEIIAYEYKLLISE